MVALALRRFWEVLKAGGKLFVEEEFPIGKRDIPAQGLWAEKWRILKSAMMLTGRLPYNEIAPELLEGLCHLAGFEQVQWTAHSETFRDPRVLDFFQIRLDGLLPELADESLRIGFTELAAKLRAKALQAGGMEVPYYRLTAQKGGGK